VWGLQAAAVGKNVFTDLHCGMKWAKVVTVELGWRGSSHPSIRAQPKTAMAYRGVYEHTLDAKKRITLPRPYRTGFSDGLVLAIPPDLKPCIWIARPADYEAYTQAALAELSPLSAKRLELERFFFGNSHDATLDGRERLMLPAQLIDHAKLKERVLIVGAGQRLEVWDPEAWRSYRPGLLDGAQELTGGA